MPILLKYILREYLKVLALCLGMLLLVYLAIDFFGKIGRLVQEDASFSMIFLYFGLKIPKILFDISPIGILVATLITLGLQSRNNEIVVVTAFALSLITGAANLSFIPMTKQKTDFVRAVKIKKYQEQSYFGQNRLWLREGRHTFINIDFADSINRVLHKATIYKLRDDFTLEESMEADRIEYENGTWMMDRGRIRRFSTDGTMTETTFEKEPVALSRKPSEFKGLDVDTDKMKYSELRKYINRLAKDGYDVARFRVDLYSKVSLPFVNFLMTLIAIPFGLVETRSRGVARGVGLSLLIGTSYWIIHSVALSMGHGGLIPPLLAGTFANLLFLSTGIYLFLGIRQ